MQEIINDEFLNSTLNSIIVTDSPAGAIKFLEYEIEDELKDENGGSIATAIGIRLKTKNYEMQTLQLSAMGTGNQVLDLLKSEVSNALTKMTLEKMRLLGKKSFDEKFKSEWNPSLIVKGKEIVVKEKVRFWKNPLKWFKVLFSKGTIMDPMNEMQAIQARLSARILALSSKLASINRRGPATAMIVSPYFGSMLMANDNFVSAENSKPIFVTSGIYAIGSFYGIKVLIDQNMSLDDNRITLLRKGTKEEIGLHLILGNNPQTVQRHENINLVDKTLLIIKYNILEVGSHPELNYLTAEIEVPTNHM